MGYNLYLKYEAEDLLNIQDEVTEVWDGIAASIFHETDEAVKNAVDNSPERTKIGFITFLVYNQVLAMTYGVNMTQDPLISRRIDGKPIMELDYTIISQETIDEIGEATSPNILVLEQFGISPAWRNKGIGEQVLKSIMKKMKSQYGYMIIMQPEPVQFNEYRKKVYYRWGVEMDGLENDPEKAQWKLNAFFQRCGFRLFKNYNDVFICNIDQAVPDQVGVHSAV
jgi:GNAT superfamily N-acetyltransferase